MCGAARRLRAGHSPNRIDGSTVHFFRKFRMSDEELEGMTSFRELAEEVDELGEGLDSWEVEFVESMLRLLRCGNPVLLTSKQRWKLEHIYLKRVPQ